MDHVPVDSLLDTAVSPQSFPMNLPESHPGKGLAPECGVWKGRVGVSAAGAHFPQTLSADQFRGTMRKKLASLCTREWEGIAEQWRGPAGGVAGQPAAEPSLLLKEDREAR